MVALPRARSPVGRPAANALTWKSSADIASTSSARFNLNAFFMFSTSPIEVRIEDANRRDLVSGQLVELGRLANCLRGWCVVDAEGFPVVLSDIRVHPCDAELRVRADHRHAGLRSLLRQRNLKSVGERALHHEPRHTNPPCDLLSDPGGSPLDARLGPSGESANREKAQAVLSSGAHFWRSTLPPGRGNQNRACPGCGGRGCRSSVLRDKAARRSHDCLGPEPAAAPRRAHGG